MVSLILILILLISLYAGARRGLILQVVYSVGYAISFMVAVIYYGELGPELEMFVPYPSATQNSKLSFFDDAIKFDLDQAFYHGVAFLIILALGWLVTRLIGALLNRLAFVPLIKQANWIGGGFVGLVTCYVGLFLILYLMAMLPVPSVQNGLNNSFVAKIMIEHTPILTNQIYHWWVQTKI